MIGDRASYRCCVCLLNGTFISLTRLQAGQQRFRAEQSIYSGAAVGSSFKTLFNMGIFNLFRKKEASQTPEPYQYAVEDLLQVPKTERDESWRRNFLAAILNLPLYPGRIETIKSPDGMEYTNLETACERDDIAPVSLASCVSNQITTGLGIAINGTQGAPDWAFTYGDLVDFYVNGAFYSGNIKSPFGGGFVTDKYMLDRQARVGQPSEIYLPIETRAVLRNFLNSFGLTPKICLVLWVQTNELSLAFNIVPEMFENTDEAAFQSLINFLGWYLPRHYQVICMHEDESFKPL